MPNLTDDRQDMRLGERSDMKDEDKPKEYLVAEVGELRRKLAESEASRQALARAVEKLRDSQRKLRSLLDSSPEPIVVYNARGISLFVNSAFVRTFGWSREEVTGKRIDYVPDECAQETRETLARLFRGEKVPPFETKRMTKDGRILDIHISSAPYRDKNGGIGGHIVTLRDVTAYKQAEGERLLLAAAVEQAAEAIMITDREGKILYLNPAFQKITGFSREEAIGHRPSLLRSGKHSDQFYQRLWATLKKGQPWKGRFVNRKKDGQIYQEDATISPVRDSSGKIVNYVAVKRDVTHEVKLEKQLQIAQKMEAVGSLAAGIAHDFNNLLTVIQGFTEMLLLDKHPGDPEHDDLGKILQAAENGADLVRRLAAFTRGGKVSRKHVDLNSLLEEVKDLLERTLPKMIELDLQLDKDIHKVRADKNQIEQVLLNLAVNAKDAMPHGGRLSFTTENVMVDEERPGEHVGVKSGTYVLLVVADSGHGMEKEILDHIFEPFYTTKQPGAGTGLGLAAVYNTVKQHGGFIDCSSKPGVGTTFRVYWPASGGDVEERQAKPPTEIKGGSETLLFVDDDRYIRDLASKTFTRAGYKVLTASNGHEALDIFARKQHEISLVILDLVMPEMGGERCLEELLKIDPEAKTLIASGVAERGPGRKAPAEGTSGFIS
ncbi:MAG: PAS domain S-box protein, partial [Deltaproteobacteria bacterium]